MNESNFGASFGGVVMGGEPKISDGDRTTEREIRGCFEAGHDVGMRHEDGSLYSATCHDCGKRYVRGDVSATPNHGDHDFEPGIDVDMAAEGRSPDPHWCNVCGEQR